MGMWRWKVDTPLKLEYFKQEFVIPADVHFRLAGEEDSIMPKDDSMPFPVIAFVECGLRLPPDILFLEFLHYYKLNPMQLAIISYRVINVLPQPQKDFCKNFYPSKDFKKLLNLPINQHKAPLLLNYIPTYKSVLPDIPKKSKSPPSATTPTTTSSPRPDQGSTFGPMEQPSTSAPQIILPSQHKRRRRTAATVEMGHKKAVVDDLLANIPNIVTVQPSPSQSQPKPKPKPKRLKKAQPKATITQIDSEDTLSISKIAKVEKSASTAEKRPAEAAPSESTRSKKPRSESTKTLGSMKSDAPWAPLITIKDKLVKVGDSATDLEVGVAFSTALFLPKDLECNTEVSEYENSALMLQHSVQAIQHAYSFAMQAFDIKKELVNKTKEADSLLKTVNKAEAKMKTLMDQAKAAKKAQDEADERAGAAKAIAKVLEAEKKEAEAKTAEAQAELIAALAAKDAEIKTADEKAYAERATDIKEDYKKQELAVPEDSALKNASNLVLPFPPSPSQSEDEVESEEEAEVEKSEKAMDAGAKSPTLNEQVLDLTQDKADEVSKDATPEKKTSDAPITKKSIDQTL
ncbi:uncharacterized protein LOC114277328 [Camellia sinensis]|uniref:uncharacterized protein LOC114277328 n=1 Tax=Camellia sinensis TaxID=4442 RepID=UPI001035B5D8|nr:uncharacterized protein LOC114277328 [Camellia sinensis]